MATITSTASTTSLESLETSSEEKEAGLSASLISGLDQDYDIALEDGKLRNVIDIAMLKVDYKTGKEVLNSKIKWTVHNTRDKNVSVIYRKLDNDGMITMRSCMDIECNINDVYDFFDCEANDDLKLAIKNDKFMKSYNIHKVYDNDRCLVHTTFSTGVPKSVVKPRDFFYMKRRFKYDNCMYSALFCFVFIVDLLRVINVCKRVFLFRFYCFVLQMGLYSWLRSLNSCFAKKKKNETRDFC